MDVATTDFRELDVQTRIQSVSFRFYSDSEARALSVCRISETSAFDDLGRPVPSGLYDPRLGPISYAAGACHTCGQNYGQCPGHFGHIEVPVPLVHPLLVGQLHKILKASCWKCQRLRISQRRKLLLLAQLRFLHADMPRCAEFVDAYKSNAGEEGKAASGATRDEGRFANELVRHTEQVLLHAAPGPIAKAIKSINWDHEKAVDAAIAGAAELAWKDCAARGKLLDRGGAHWNRLVAEMLHAKSAKNLCVCCSEKVLSIGVSKFGTFHFGKRDIVDVVLASSDLEQYLAKLWSNEQHLMELVYGLKGRPVRRGKPPLDYSMFFVRAVLVPPSRFRPAACLSDTGHSTEHPQNIFFQRILSTVEALVATLVEIGDVAEDGDDGEIVSAEVSPAAKRAKTARKRKLPQGLANNRSKKVAGAEFVADMQRALMDLYDSPSDDMRSGGAAGIRQQFESKQGLFRNHMMGKRVNFSCRSVIGPDVFLDTNEVGIPQSFAKLLTVAEPVTPQNVERLRAAILNGPDVYPGANAIEDWSRSGVPQTVKLRSPSSRKQLETQAKLLMRNSHQPEPVAQDGSHAKSGNDPADANDNTFDESHAMLQKRVQRHVRDGDIVLFNRQPTLHRVSVMAHKVRVLPADRTIRFHYANCNSYNADFDGDEMNVHVPQDDVARAEARHLMLSDKHYIVPTSGTPVRGLIQDHILSACLITKRDTFFDRGWFCQLLFGATERIAEDGSGGCFPRRYHVPVPAVLKPVPLWTGKQLVSAVLDVIRRDRPGFSLEVKSRVKADLVGPEECQVIVRRGELLQGILDKNAFGAAKYGIVHAVQESYGSEDAGSFLSAIGRLCTLFARRRGFSTGVDDLILRQEAEQKRILIYNTRLHSIEEDATKHVQRSLEKEDGIAEDMDIDFRNGAKEKQTARQRNAAIVSEMVRTKGVVAEARLDSAMNGRLNAMGSDINRCVPSQFVKKFPWNGFSLMTDTGAKGSVVNSCQIACLVGATTLEGQRVPRMGGTGATLPCFAPYDASANAGGFIAGRFLTGLAPHEYFFHTLAGREGILDTSMKTANSGYLQRCLMKHLEGIRLHYDYTVRDSDGRVLQMLYGDDGIDPCKSSWLFEKVQWQSDNRGILSSKPGLIVEDRKARKLLREATKHANYPKPKSTTVLEAASPGALSVHGVVSERFEELMRSSVDRSASSKEQKAVLNFLKTRYLLAAAEPGDAVGILASHSVGEPSTQMTLNTFHHAGSESKHVTMGIPRLRELVMTASKYPKTPSMTLPIRRDLGEAGAKQMTKLLAKVALGDLVEQIVVREGALRFHADLGGVAVREFTVVIYFPDESLYAEDIGTNLTNLWDRLGAGFCRLLEGKCLREVRRVGANVSARKKSSVGAVMGLSQNTPEEYSRSLKEMDIIEDEPDADVENAKQENDALVEKCDSEAEKSGDESDAEGGYGDSDDDTDPEAVANENVPDESVGKEFSGKRGASEKKTVSQDRCTIDGENGGVFIPVTVEEESDESVGVSEAEQSSRRHAALGLAGKATVLSDKRSVEIPWMLPQDAMARVRVPELVRETVSELFLTNVSRITRCFTEDYVENGETLYAVATEGSNLSAVLHLGDGLLDFDRVMTNDFYGILNVYGVEATRTALISEFQKIFDAYGIPVDIRHLALIADYMTANGGYRGFNRGAIGDAPSTFQQMTFETSIKFLNQATLSGSMDVVRSNPSACIAVGELYNAGTGAFDLLTPIS